MNPIICLFLVVPAVTLLVSCMVWFGFKVWDRLWPQRSALAMLKEESPIITDPIKKAYKKLEKVKKHMTKTKRVTRKSRKR